MNSFRVAVESVQQQCVALGSEQDLQQMCISTSEALQGRQTDCRQASPTVQNAVLQPAQAAATRCECLHAK